MRTRWPFGGRRRFWLPRRRPARREMSHRLARPEDESGTACWIVRRSSPCGSPTIIASSGGAGYGAPPVGSMDAVELMDAPAPDHETGLHFLCFNANIANQFQFIQFNWAGSPKFERFYNDPDPLIGVSEEGRRSQPAFTIPASPSESRARTQAIRGRPRGPICSCPENGRFSIWRPFEISMVRLRDVFIPNPVIEVGPVLVQGLPLLLPVHLLDRVRPRGGPTPAPCKLAEWPPSPHTLAAAPPLAGRPAAEGTTMSHQQKRHERHEHDRRTKRARQRQSAVAFNRPGESPIRARWFLIAGAGVCGLVLLLWALVTRL